MTKTSERLANSVVKLLTDAQVISDMIIATPSKHLVKGFLFERTPNKENFYIWKLCTPLYSPMMKNINLNYSQRLDTGERTDRIVIPREHGVLAQNIARIFNLTFKDRGRLDVELSEFLETVEETGRIRSNMMLEVAIGHGINGNFLEAERRLEEILSLKTNSPILPRVKSIAQQALTAINQNNKLFMDLVRKWEEKNIEIHFPGLIVANVQ